MGEQAAGAEPSDAGDKENRRSLRIGDKVETEPVHSSGGLGCWGALPWLRGLTAEANTAAGAVTSIRPAVCRSPAGKAGVKCGHGAGGQLRGSRLASHTVIEGWDGCCV